MVCEGKYKRLKQTSLISRRQPQNYLLRVLYPTQRTQRTQEKYATNAADATAKTQLRKRPKSRYWRGPNPEILGLQTLVKIVFFSRVNKYKLQIWPSNE